MIKYNNYKITLDTKFLQEEDDLEDLPKKYCIQPKTGI